METMHSRTGGRRALAWLAAACVALGSAGRSAAQDVGEEIRRAQGEIAKVKREIQRADAELRRTDSLMREEGARAAQSEDRQAKDRQRRDQELAALQARLAETQGRIDAERNALARGQNGIDEIKAREAQLAKTLAGWCDSLERRVEAGLPWENQARLDRIRALRKDLEGGTASAEEGLTRISAIVREEVKAGDEIALYNKPLTRGNGEVVNAQILRLGNQWLAYMDEEGKRFGMMEREGGRWAWREELSFAERNRVKEAIEVKGAKAPPKLVVLDVAVSAGAATPAAPAPASPAPREKAPKAPAPAQSAPAAPAAPQPGSQTSPGGNR